MMWEGRSRAEWLTTAAVIAMIANTARNPELRATPYEPWEFNPWIRRRRKEAMIPYNPALAEAILTGRQAPA